MNEKLQEDIRRNFDRYISVFPHEEKEFVQWKEQLENDKHSLNNRKNMIGHATASGIIFSSDYKKVLLIFHNACEKYIQPGGHVDDSDENLAEAAQGNVDEDWLYTLKKYL